METELRQQCDSLREKLSVLQAQHETLKADHRDLQRQYAKLSVQAMRLQRNNTMMVIRENEVFIDNQHISMQNTLSAGRMQEMLSSTIIPFHMITENMAIGDYTSSYETFDIIINANFMGDSQKCKHHDMSTTTNNGKQVTYISMYDNMEEKAYMKMILHSMIPVLIHHVKRNLLIKILFHCYAGVSRSGSFGVAFMAHLYGLTYEDALQKIREKRVQVDPNPGFVEAIKEYLEEVRELESMVVV
jgi:hypothetical protein